MSDATLKNKTRTGLCWMSINQFVNYGLQFIVSIIMARLLSPSDYGITALPAVFISIAQVFIDSGFSEAMVRKIELKDEDISTAFLYSMSIGVFCYFLIFICAPLISVFYNEPVLVPLIRITALTFIWGPLATPQKIILKRKLDFKTPAKIAVCSNIIGAIIGVTCAYLGYGLWSLVAMSLVSSFLSFLFFWFSVKWIPKTSWSFSSFKYLWGYGNKMVLANLIERIYSNLVPLIVGKFFSTEQLGIYNRAKNFSDIPSQQGTNIIQQVSFPVLSKLQNDDEILARNYRKMLKASVFVLFPVMTMLAALSEPIIMLLLSEKWKDSILILRLLCFSAMWYPVHAINLNLLQVKGRSDLFLKLEYWKKGFGLLVMAITLPYGLIYFVAATIVSSLFSLIVNTYYTGKLIGVGFIQQIKDILPSFISSIFIFVATMLINNFIVDYLMQLFIGGLLGVLTYLFLAIISGSEAIKDIRFFLKR